MNYQTLIDNTTTAGTTYICKAELGRATSQAYWQIKAIDSSGNVKYPKNSKGFPSDEFIFIADDRASYTYAYNS